MDNAISIYGQAFEVITMLFQVYFRQLSATDTVLNANQNGFPSAFSIHL
jgi:hypothetical protein